VAILRHVPQANAFDSDSLRPIVESASRAAGLSADGAELLRIGENAIYRLAHDPVVVRIARSAARMDIARRELCVAQWLEHNAIPTIKVHEIEEQPLLIDGYPVTFWRAVTGPNGGAEPNRSDLARLLLAFHGADRCPCDLPIMDPSSWAKVEERISVATGIDDEARKFLSSRNAELAKRVHDLECVLPRGPIHADAHTGNLLVDDSVIVLSDFEGVSIGPREWDLLPTAVAVERYGLPEEQYQAFTAIYGFDVREWAGYRTLREVRELGMTTWLMQNVNEDPAIAAEFEVRLSSLQESDFGRRWSLF
jgi:Ser/Thr protein kinase RdoA (MazF antagonist)